MKVQASGRRVGLPNDDCARAQARVERLGSGNKPLVVDVARHSHACRHVKLRGLRLAGRLRRCFGGQRVCSSARTCGHGGRSPGIWGFCFGGRLLVGGHRRGDGRCATACERQHKRRRTKGQARAAGASPRPLGAGAGQWCSLHEVDPAAKRSGNSNLPWTAFGGSLFCLHGQGAPSDAPHERFARVVSTASLGRCLRHAVHPCFRQGLTKAGTWGESRTSSCAVVRERGLQNAPGAHLARCTPRANATDA